jgi:outer membrane beta-barrel protein
MSARASLAGALAALALAAAPAPGAAQSSKADAFAGKIPPVSGQLYQKAGRFELTATGNLSLNDAFYTKYFAGAKATYHLTEHWAVGLHGAGGAAVQTSSAVVCSPSKGCADADAVAMRQVPGKLRYIVGAEAAWSPVYGKLNVFSEQAAHFDLSILAGPDLIAYDEVLSKEAAAVKAPGVATSFGGHLGLGLRLFLTTAFALRFEVKDYIYAVSVPNGAIGNDVQNQLFAEVGVSYFFAGRSGPPR